MNYFIIQNEETKGPYTIGQLRAMWQSGAVTANVLHCREGDAQWTPLSSLASVLELKEPGGVQVIEQTGKTWKRRQLFAVIPALLGLVMVAVGAGMELNALMIVGAVICACGLIAVVTVGALTWWHHG